MGACVNSYDAILIADVPKATEALQKGDPKFAEEGSIDAANEAKACECGFFGKSPITDYNNVVHDVAAITTAIVKVLLQ